MGRAIGWRCAVLRRCLSLVLELFAMNANSIFEKYRPRTWSELVGQDAIVKRIDTIRQRFHGLGGKAYWLTGASGTRKSTAARLIADEVAQCEFSVSEMDASDLTADFLRDYDRRVVGKPLGGNGWAFIANESHLLSRAQIGKLLTVIEPAGGLRPYVVWCFTTTNSGEEKLFADCDDAGPLLSRCIQLPLSRRDLAKPFAIRAQQIAQAEGLDGRPLEAYIRLVQKHRQNFRAVLQEIASGAMLLESKGGDE
jgi:hypothetical protein